MKDSIIEAVKEANTKLQKNLKSLKLGYLIWEKLQINRNNLEINGIQVGVKDEQLEQKANDIFSHLNINIFKPDFEDYHRLGKSNTIVKFINCKVCKDTLEKSLRLIDLLITQSLVLKGRKSCLFVRIYLPTTNVLPKCVGS